MDEKNSNIINEVKSEIDLDLMDLGGKLQRLMDAVEVMKERQEQMALDIGKIKEAVYNPDQGLYARVRTLETWKSTSTRMLWIVVTSLGGLLTATIWNLLMSTS
jgi:hypothetical protein